jgi:hypothetical protein
LLALAAVLVAAQRSACGQEAMRISTQANLAATAAKEQREGASEGYYNFLVGPTAWRLSSGMGFQYNDNIYAVSQSPQGDFILMPTLGTQMHWPVTLNNSLDLSLNGGYSEYLEHSDLSRFFLNAGTGLNFDVYVGDCQINLHELISISQYNYQNPGVSGGYGNQNSQSLQNTLGTSATWDFGPLLSSIGFDHVNYLSLVGNATPDTTSENFTGNVRVPLRPDLTVGLEAGGSLISYGATYVTAAGPHSTATSSQSTDAAQWSVGGLGTVAIGDHFSVQVHGGFTEYLPENTGTGGSSGSETGFYASISATHQLNQWLNYTLSAGHSTDLSSYGQVQTRTYGQLTPTCTLFKQYTLSTPLTYQQGTQPGYTPTAGVPHYEQFMAEFNISRPITKRLTAGLSYQYIKEDSNDEFLAYTENIISLNFSYQF